MKDDIYNDNVVLARGRGTTYGVLKLTDGMTVSELATMLMEQFPPNALICVAKGIPEPIDEKNVRIPVIVSQGRPL